MFFYCYLSSIIALLYWYVVVDVEFSGLLLVTVLLGKVFIAVTQ